MAIDIERGCIDTKNWVCQMLDEIATIPTGNFRKLLIYSLIDAFAQCWDNYSRLNNADIFASFLEKFAGDDILMNICPATLFYDYGEKYSFSKLQFTPGMIIYANDPAAQKEAERLLQQITDQKEREKANKKHTYAHLMYAERNKLVHELNRINSPIDFNDDKDNPIPHIAYGSYITDIESDQSFWMLHIPERFVEKILFSAVEGYVEYCKSEGMFPFENNTYDRKCRLAWYD